MGPRNEPSLSTSTSTLGVHDAFLGVPDTDNSQLPDLGASNEPTLADVLNQTSNNEPTQEVNTTEDELDAADALLSLSNIPELDTNLEIDDNALLVPIGGQAICDDIAPTESRLGQVEVDNEIARLIDAEEQANVNTSTTHTPVLRAQDVNAEKHANANIPATETPLLGVQDKITTVTPKESEFAIAKADATQSPAGVRSETSNNRQPWWDIFISRRTK